MLVFVEVNSRRDPATLGWAVAPTQWRRIAHAASGYVRRTPALQECRWRFDLVVLSPRRLPRHLPDMWRP